MSILFRKIMFWYTFTPWDCSSGCNFPLLKAVFGIGVRYGALQVRNLREFRVGIYRRTPRRLKRNHSHVRGVCVLVEAPTSVFIPPTLPCTKHHGARVKPQAKGRPKLNLDFGGFVCHRQATYSIPRLQHRWTHISSLRVPLEL